MIDILKCILSKPRRYLSEQQRYAVVTVGVGVKMCRSWPQDAFCTARAKELAKPLMSG